MQQYSKNNLNEANRLSIKSQELRVSLIVCGGSNFNMGLPKIWRNGFAHVAWIMSALVLSYLYNFIDYIFEIWTFQGLNWCIICLCPFKFILSILIILGGTSMDFLIHILDESAIICNYLSNSKRICVHPNHISENLLFESCDTLNWVRRMAKGQRSHFANFQSEILACTAQ